MIYEQPALYPERSCFAVSVVSAPKRFALFSMKDGGQTLRLDTHERFVAG